MRLAVVVVLLFFSSLALADQPAPIRPDPKLTPGATFDVTLQDISSAGYSKKVRHVTSEVKREVFAEYGITEHHPGEYEVITLFHFQSVARIPSRIFGRSRMERSGMLGVKDRLEDRLHALVVHRKLDLKTAQQEIATDWIAAYKKYVGPTPTSARRLSYSAEAPRESGSRSDQDDLNSSSASSMGKVWVNTRLRQIFQT
jgi:hypothetical protein